MARRRPSAFEVSFPAEAAEYVASEAISRENSENHLKRPNGESDHRTAKRKQLPPVAYYATREDKVQEDRHLLVPGEDRDDNNEDGEKPIRLLCDFAIFDSRHRNEMVSLAEIEQEDRADRQFEGAGVVMAYFFNDEDEGQEDDLEGEPLYVRLGAILRYTVDYTNANEPFYIETEFAWYILQLPSDAYRPHFENFYTPRRIAQLVVSDAIKHPHWRHEEFIKIFEKKFDIFEQNYTEEDLWRSVPEIQEAIEGCAEPKKLGTVPFVRHLLKAAPAPAPTKPPKHPPRQRGPQNVQNLRAYGLVGNLDLAVLKAENQTPTHVTPLIASLAQGLVREDLVVVGPRPPRPDKQLLLAQRKREFQRVWRYLQRAHRKRNVDHQREDRVRFGGSMYLKALEVDGEIVKPGDCIIVLKGKYKGSEAPDPPRSLDEISPSVTLDEYFWFAKIHYLILDQGKAHVQWFEHARQSFLQELGHEQELFIMDICDHVSFEHIIAKVHIHETPGQPVPPDEYFYKFKYDSNLSVFSSFNKRQMELAATHSPPDNCPPCLLYEAQQVATVPVQLKDENGINNGIIINGKKIHLEDFVLYYSDKGPAHIGHVVNFYLPEFLTHSDPCMVTIKKVGRIASISEKIRPVGTIKDERHVYLTNERKTINAENIIRVIFVFPFQSFTPEATLEEWLKLSPDHFYVRYKFPGLQVASWGDKCEVSCTGVNVCIPCCKEKLKQRQQIDKFLAGAKHTPYSTLDLFGGVGAFTRGLAEGSGCLKVTHAIEISPSAAKTFKRNSPDTLVFNQCANVILRYAIKSHSGHKPDVPCQRFDEKLKVPLPPKPGDIKILVAGFPCQSHSTLNMYKVADDIKSNLILTTLAYIDFLRPPIVFVENVPGFLKFNLNAVQASQYRVEGGIEMGGLKLLIRALLDMNYQVRYGLLQAGSYGTPQRRVRFFLIAAMNGTPLPELPQPSHDFLSDKLNIKLPNGEVPEPIRLKEGTAAHPFVSIDDAIGDLPRFDWKPKKQFISLQKEREQRQRAQLVRAIECDQKLPYCGLSGRVQYEYAPKTSYQVYCRQKPTIDLQHFTKCLKPENVDRVVSIPLTAGSDYRDLRPDQWQWQFANPSSSVARLNYRPGLYGRLDKNGFFPTTVTNVDPTAKQSWVLNPFCKRMVTVRELARSQGFPDCFVFEATDNNIVIMHRQIGNAVPLPVGIALGRELRNSLLEKWRMDQDNTIYDDIDMQY